VECALVVVCRSGGHEVEAAAAADAAHLAHGAQHVVRLQRQVLQPRPLVLLQVRLQSMVQPSVMRVRLGLMARVRTA